MNYSREYFHSLKLFFMKDKTYQSKLDITTSKISIREVKRQIKEKNYDKALKLCDDALNNGEDWQFLNLKALTLTRLKKHEKAVEYFNKALNITSSSEIKSNKAKALYDWAKQLYFPDCEYKKALLLIDEAIGLINSDEIGEYYFLKAEILESLGDNIEAKKYYFKAEGRTDEVKNLENQMNLFKEYENDTLISITGYTFYKGIDVFKKGVVLNLVKEPTNEHDSDAIQVILNNELVGYVANSQYLLINEIKSASQIKYLFKNQTKAEVLFIYLNEMVICRLVN